MNTHKCVTSLSVEFGHLDYPEPTRKLRVLNECKEFIVFRRKTKTPFRSNLKFLNNFEAFDHLDHLLNADCLAGFRKALMNWTPIQLDN